MKIAVYCASSTAVSPENLTLGFNLGSVKLEEEETKTYNEAMSLLAFIESASTLEHINTFVGLS